MATKSFTSEFKLNKKAAHRLVNDLEKSKRVDVKFNQRVETVKDKERINKIMASFSGK